MVKNFIKAARIEAVMVFLLRGLCLLYYWFSAIPGATGLVECLLAEIKLMCTDYIKVVHYIHYQHVRSKCSKCRLFISIE
jgi:hypothetical protein